MGFVLSVLYFVAYYLTPKVIFGPLAAYRIELLLAALIAVVSLPKLLASIPLRTPQSLALIGLALAVLLSVIVGARWLGGAVDAFLLFIPNAFGYFLVCLHFNSKRRLQVLAIMLFSVCLFVIVQGVWELHRGTPVNGPPLVEDTGRVDRQLWGADYPYLLPMKNDAGEWFYRLEGEGEIDDPNDFGQLTVCVIPLMFLFWRPKKKLWNLACVLLPVSVLLAGVFLTRSRGALVALAVLALLAARRRIGTVAAVVLSGGLFAAFMALQFTGGREISANAGSDRTSLWGDSLQLLKVHPIFGVGFGNLHDYLGLTAHNSVAVCLAELGLFGLFFWSLFLFPTLRDALTVASPAKVTAGQPVVVETQPFPGPVKKEDDVITDSEINSFGRLMVLSLAGYLVAGFFLSRAFVMTLFLLGGVAEVFYSLALDRKMIGPRLKLGRVAMYSAMLAASCVGVLYIVVRAANVMR